MKNILLITILLITVVSATAATAEFPPNPVQSSPMTNQEMSQVIGSGCDKATGLMLSFAFASGYIFAINPLASVGFLASAGAIGVGIALLC